MKLISARRGPIRTLDIRVHLQISCCDFGCIHMAGFLGVITRLRNPLLASLRDSPKPRPDLPLVIQGFGRKALLRTLSLSKGHQGRGRVRL